MNAVTKDIYEVSWESRNGKFYPQALENGKRMLVIKLPHWATEEQISGHLRQRSWQLGNESEVVFLTPRPEQNR